MEASAVQWLSQEYLERRSKNPLYSLRAFARQLKISPGALSQVLSRKRSLTWKQAEKIADALGLSPQERNLFIAKVKRPAGASIHPDQEIISFETFAMIADWYHYGILNLMLTKDFESSPQWIAKRLGITPVEARMALERLERLDFIERKKGTWKRKAPAFTTKPDVPNAAMRRLHRQNINFSLEKLESVPVNLRDITFTMMAIDVDKLPEAKKIIHQFKQKISKVLESGNRTEVYTLNVQLIPLSKRSSHD